MTLAVTANCHHSRSTDYVAVCLVNCFHGDVEMLHFCGACAREYLVEATYLILPDDETKCVPVNAARAPRPPSVDVREEPIESAEAWSR